MHVSPYSKASHMLCWDDAPNLIFCIKCEGCFWQRVRGHGHKGLIDAVRSSSNHPYISKEGYEALKQQWMSLTVAHHPICRGERVPEIWYFAWNSGVVFGRKYIKLTTRGTSMVTEALSMVLTYLSKVTKYSSGNGCHLSQCSILFVVLKGCIKSDIMHQIWKSFS